MNMIMDTLAAIALAAERPMPESIKEKPVSENDDLISVTMWKNIDGMIIYISTVMFIMFWFNEDFWGFTYGMEEDMFSRGEPTNKCRAFTMLFNIFIWMHIFNLINCRDIRDKKFNPFRSIFSNKLFLFVLAGTISFQYVMVEYGGVLARTSGLTNKQHSFSILIGASSLFASIILKKLPDKITKFLYFGQKDSHIRAVPEDALTKRFNKFQNINAAGLMMQKIQEKKNKKSVKNEDPYSKEEAERLDRDERA